jgi:hypothetical protein
MLAAEEVAREHYDRMTLTAFRDVPFNGPFYESLGWRAMSADGLPPGIAAARRDQAEAGLDAWPRQAMAKQGAMVMTPAPACRAHRMTWRVRPDV